MKFSLKTLLILVTLAGVLVALGIAVVAQRARVAAHKSSFVELDNYVSTLDNKLRLHILKIPQIEMQLRKKNAVDPPMALGQSIMGESQAFETYSFSRSFHYDWQLDDGSRGDGVKFLVESVLTEDSLDAHVVRLSYQPNTINSDIATWLAAQIEQADHVKIQLVELQQPPAARIEDVEQSREPACALR